MEPFWTILDHFDHFDHFLQKKISHSEIFSGRFDTSGSMVPRLVPEISSLDAFCDGAAGAGAGAAGIGDSRSWILVIREKKSKRNNAVRNIFFVLHETLTHPKHFFFFILTLSFSC